MSNDKPESTDTAPWYQRASDMSKGVRDTLIVIILLTLILFPGFVNDRLINAGFTNADIAGFQWEKQVQEASEQTGEAIGQVSRAVEKLQSVQAELNALVRDANEPAVRERAASLSSSIDTSIKDVQLVREDLRSSMMVQRSLLEQVPERSTDPDAEWGVQIAAVKTVEETEKYLEEAHSMRLRPSIYDTGERFHIIITTDNRSDALEMSKKLDRSFTGAFPKNISEMCPDAERSDDRKDWWVCR